MAEPGALKTTVQVVAPEPTGLWSRGWVTREPMEPAARPEPTGADPARGHMHPVGSWIVDPSTLPI